MVFSFCEDSGPSIHLYVQNYDIPLTLSSLKLGTNQTENSIIKSHDCQQVNWYPVVNTM